MLLRPLRAQPLTHLRHSRRAFASASSPVHSLLYVEHQSGEVEAGTLSALTAASQLGGRVTGLVVGSPGDVERIVEKVKKCVGIFSSISDLY